MRRLWLILIPLLLALLAADFGFKIYAEQRFAAQVQQGLGLERKPSLHLGGFPFILAMSRGRLPSANVSADRVMEDGLQIEHVEIDLKALTFTPGAVLSGRASTIRASSGSGTATVSAADMTAYLNFKGYPGRVRFGAGTATVDVGVAGTTITVTGPLSVLDGRLVFTPTRVDSGPAGFPVSQVGFSFELPRPFEGFTYTKVVVTKDRATLQARVRSAVIPVQPAA